MWIFPRGIIAFWPVGATPKGAALFGASFNNLAGVTFMAMAQIFFTPRFGRRFFKWRRVSATWKAGAGVKFTITAHPYYQIFAAFGAF